MDSAGPLSGRTVVPEIQCALRPVREIAVAITINHRTAALLLEEAWTSQPTPGLSLPASVVDGLHRILTSSRKTFKYVLVTGVLAKCVNPAAHPRALQAGSSLDGAYDARSLCHTVVVPFEKPRGDLFGLSNEPFLSKPARHLEHDKANRQLKYKALAGVLHDLLEHVHRLSPELRRETLIQALTIARLRAANVSLALAPSAPSLNLVSDFLQRFLQCGDGGARLVAVAGTFLKLFNEGLDVRAYHPNAPDAFAGTAGDIEIKDSGRLIAAFECKDRPLTLDDVLHGLGKGWRSHALEYSFIYSQGLASRQEVAIRDAVDEARRERDVGLIEFAAVCGPWSSALNSLKRNRFGSVIAETLRAEMRLSDLANTAADLWNELSETEVGAEQGA
jgi:hypothetical protein